MCPFHYLKARQQRGSTERCAEQAGANRSPSGSCCFPDCSYRRPFCDRPFLRAAPSCCVSALADGRCSCRWRIRAPGEAWTNVSFRNGRRRTTGAGAFAPRPRWKLQAWVIVRNTSLCSIEGSTSLVSSGNHRGHGPVPNVPRSARSSLARCEFRVPPCLLGDLRRLCSAA